MHFILTYELASDYLDKRGQFRGVHLRLAWEAADRGELLLGGALADPADRAVLVFQGETDEPARRFVAADPYVTNGLVKSWSIRRWNTVVGKDAANPVGR
jgi:uncharacterized protein YciI